MARRLIDLNVPIRNDSFDGTPPEIQYLSHKQVARRWAKAYGFEPSDLPEGCGGSSERLWLSSHTGTHIDTAYHYFPTSEGKPARPVDEVGLDHFFADAFRLDFTRKKPAEMIEPEDLEAALDAIGYAIKPGDIALIWTGTTDNYYDSPKFLEMQPGMNRASVLWLVERGVKVIGIDAWGIDIPFSKMAERLKAGDKAAFWQGHYAGREKEYFQIEKLAHLGEIPRAHGFQVACFPVLIERASGAWCRAVAIVEDAG